MEMLIKDLIEDLKKIDGEGMRITIECPERKEFKHEINIQPVKPWNDTKANYVIY